MMRTRMQFMIVAIVVLVADIVTKKIVVANFFRGEVRQVIGDWVQLTYILNPGAAFGLFPNSRIPLIVVSLVAVVVVTVIAWTRRGGVGSVLPLGLILGGAVGNLIDRIRQGDVVDFIRVGIPPDNYWPVFNVADSAVTVGVAWLAFELLFGHRDHAAEVTLGGEPEDTVGNVAPSGDSR